MQDGWTVHVPPASFGLVMAPPNPLRVFAVAAFLCAVAMAWAQPPAPVAKLWSARDYGGGPINLGVVQHPVSGFIYVGNGRGVLEFDGVRWRLIPLPARGPARTVAIDAEGTVWVGSYNEMAILRPDEAGELKAVSVLDRVATPDRVVEFVSQALPTPEGMCMVEQTHMYLFRPDGTTSSWKSAKVPLRAWWMDGAVHVVLTGEGIFRLEGNGEMTPVTPTGGSIEGLDLTQLRVLAARPAGAGHTMLLTSRGTLMWSGGSRSLTLVESASLQPAEDEVTAALFLRNGGSVLATETGGLMRLDKDGRVVGRWPALAAFASGRVTGFLEDRERGLWVAKAIGLARLQLEDASTTEPASPAAFVRRLSVPRGPIVAGSSVLQQGGPVVLGPEYAALAFEFAAPSYRFDELGRSGLMFRSRLEGVDNGWSDWKPEARREYANLPLSALQLRVQARDLAGREGPEAVLAISLKQHWWLTPWAWMGYAGVAGATLTACYQLLTRAHRRRAAQLEAIVAARTEDLRRSNAELARLREIDRDEKVAARLAEEKARLEVLRYQLNPHFLYNTLNSLYSLVLTSPPAAADMVLRLADFCRIALERNDEEFTSVGTCFDRMSLYLEIEKVRWGAGLQVEIEAEAGARTERMPPFLVLPLLENAIKYGGATSPELLRVRLAARMIPGEAGAPARLEIEVANSGHWNEVGEDVVPGSTGIGLENLRQRLQRYYPDRHQLVIENSDGWVRVKLLLQTASASSDAMTLAAK